MIANNCLRYNYVELLICDYHKEYALPDIPELRVETIYDPYALSDLLNDNDATLEALFNAFPQELKDEMGDEHNTIYKTHGSYALHLEMLHQFTKQIFLSATGGDDDTFDYWPTAIGIARQLAKDLDEIMATTIHTDDLYSAYQSYVIEFGRVPEYAWSENEEFENNSKEQS